MRYCLIAWLVFLIACSNTPGLAPIEERGKGASSGKRVSLNHYTVSKGDTLYAIAWRFGYDYRKLARANSIASPYTIYPGQKLVLIKPAPASATVKTTSTSTSTPTPASTPTPTEQTLSSGPISWRWPTTGKVVRGFSGDVHKGIDIGGSAGDKVAVVATGKVVYAGSGIVGYGNLLIVKHNDEYLSAYGHNRRLMVKEGDAVKQGQKIAEKGSSATNSVKLHFEIRKEGKPVDPIKSLPRRK